MRDISTASEIAAAVEMHTDLPRPQDVRKELLIAPPVPISPAKKPEILPPGRIFLPAGSSDRRAGR